MQAAITPHYGSPNVLQVQDVPMPTVGARDVLVEVIAAPVNAADLRLRAADFPSITSFLGRLAIGVRRPRHAVQGTAFAGRVARVGTEVTRYAVGDVEAMWNDSGLHARHRPHSCVGLRRGPPAGPWTLETF